MVPELESFPPSSKLRRKKPKKKNTVLMILGALVLFALFITAAYAGYVYYKYDKFADAATAGGSNQQEAAKLEEPIALLLMGMDTRAETSSINTDTIMVAVLHPKTKAVTIVSIPRDTYIKLEGLPRGKANSFYSRGEHQRSKAERNNETVTTTGPSLAKEVFGQFLGVPIENYVIVDFESFRKVVDAFGGLEVYVDQDMRYVDRADGTNINLTQGHHLLDGKNTLDFVRFRKSNQGGPDSTDIDRNKRQQLVLSKLVDKVTSLKGFLKIGQLLEIAGDHIRTDLSRSKMESIFFTFLGTKSSEIRFISLTGEWKSPYIRVNPEELNDVQRVVRDTWDGILLPPVPAQEANESENQTQSDSN